MSFEQRISEMKTIGKLTKQPGQHCGTLMKAHRRVKAFTLIELIIVVSILGILAAIVLPELQGHTQQAQEATAKDNLRILRNAIERYELENGVPPGYPSNNSSYEPTQKIFTSFMSNTDYLSAPPEDPFSESSYTLLVGNSEIFPTEADDQSGWIYQASTKTIRLNKSGEDSEGISYFDY